MQDSKRILPRQIRQKFESMKKFAEFCFPDGSTIGCDSCKVERHCSVDEIAEWIQNGFPTCGKCGTKTVLDNPHKAK